MWGAGSQPLPPQGLRRLEFPGPSPLRPRIQTPPAPPPSDPGSRPPAPPPSDPGSRSPAPPPSDLPASFPCRLGFRLHSPLQALRLLMGWLGSLQNPGWQ